MAVITIAAGRRGGGPPARAHKPSYNFYKPTPPGMRPPPASLLLLLSCCRVAVAAGPPVPHRVQAWQDARMHAADPVAGARALAVRLLGTAIAKHIVFEELHGEPTEVFSIGRRGGQPLVSGSSGVALTTGLYHYLKYFCNASVSVGALPQLALPQPLPLPHTPLRIPSPMQFHWYGSFMANSYTQAFWGWKRWESHLDWCALLGFDLVMVCESLPPHPPPFGR